MAEALGILGSISAVVNIIDATSKVISTISDLRARWKDADLTLLSLASQLAAFRTALRRIEEWMDNAEPEVHHQLVMDFDDTISCCHTLIRKIEIVFSDWESLVEKPMDAASRRKVMFGSKDLDRVLILVERQTNALALLLTACNCKTISDQQKLLQKPRVRKVLHHTKLDTMSLFVHRDTASIRSKMTDNLSKLSLVFDFDETLFSSNVYHRVFRGSIKQLLRSQQENKVLSDDKNVQVLQPAKATIQDLVTQDEFGLLWAALTDHTDFVDLRIEAMIRILRNTPNTDELDEVFRKDIPLTTVSPSLHGKTHWFLFDTHGKEITTQCHLIMFLDCVAVTLHLLKELPELMSLIDMVIPEPLSGKPFNQATGKNILDIWWHPTFNQQLPNIGLLKTKLNEAKISAIQLDCQGSEAIASLFTYQLHNLRAGFFHSQVAHCFRSLALAYEASIGVYTLQSSPDRLHTFSLHTIWTRFKPASAGDFEGPSLVVFMDVNLTVSGYVNAAEQDQDTTQQILQLLPANPGHLIPVTIILFVAGLTHIINPLVNFFLPDVEEIKGNEIEATVRLVLQNFNEANGFKPIDYVMMWDNKHMHRCLLEDINEVYRKGQVTKINGIVTAKLISRV